MMAHAQAPSITSFSPASGPVGTTVTITGTNFSAIPSNNIVFFGAVKAAVSAATNTTLTVKVPVGATYLPLTVTVNQLTGYAAKPFAVTFSAGNTFSSSFFSGGRVFTTSSNTYDIAVADFDGDGKPDVATTNTDANNVSVLRNVTAGDTIVFDNKKDFNTGNYPYAIIAGDINGDGKPDLAITNYNDATISVLLNNSTIGNISFNPKSDFVVGTNPLSMSFGDLDSDGKPDLMVANWTSNSISILRNTGSAGIVSFAAAISYAVNTNPVYIGAGDIDGDKKIDIAVLHRGGALSVLRNTSTAGIVTLNTNITVGTGFSNSSCLNVADFDNDGKVDIAVSDDVLHQVLRNTSAPGSFSFSISSLGSIYPRSHKFTVGDINGDGKPDIVSGYSEITNYAVGIKNFSVPGTIEFGGEYILMEAAGDPRIIAVADLNADGKADVISSNSTSNSVSVFANKFLPGPDIISFTPITATKGDTVTITGTNLSGTTAVSFGGTDAVSVTNISSSTVKAVVGNGASGKIVIANINGTDTISGFTYIPPKPKITSFDPSYGSVDWPGINIFGNNFIEINSVTIGGMPASFVVVNENQISADASNVASGYVKVQNISGADSLPGFIYYSLPLIKSFSPVNATTGDTITVKGSHFISTSSVQLGNALAISFQVLSDTVIKAVVGNGGADTNIYIGSLGGSAMLGGYHFYTHPPALASFTPNAGDSGTIVTIRGKFLTEVTDVKFGGTAAFSFTVINDTTISAVVNKGASGAITVTNITSTASLPGFTFIPTVPPPVINSFTPSSANIGTTVVISGSNFSSNAANNAVYFGAVKANILSASSTALTVTVPSGASYAPIIVTVIPNKLTAFSVKVFSPIFPNNDSSAAYKFKQQSDLITSASPYRSAIADFDGDGKPDIAITYPGSDSISVFRNISLGTNVSFTGKTDFKLLKAGRGITAADINGDGKLDIIITHTNTSDNVINIGILKNTSNTGSISFADETPVNQNFGTTYNNSAVRDFNSDGKPDIVATDFLRYRNYYGDGPVTVFKNSGSAGNIAFAAGNDFYTNNYYSYDFICTGDIDGDNKPDIVMSSPYSKAIVILRNNVTDNQISFTEEGSYPIAYTPGGVSMGDVDGDGKTDLVTTLQGYQVFSVSRNISTPGHIEFAYRADFNTGDFQQNIVLRDMDGDGKPDIALTKSYNTDVHSVSLFKNKSTPGSLSFEYKNVYNTGAGPVEINAGDLNADGRADLISINSGSNTISVFRNVIGAPPSISSISPTSGGEGVTVIIKGENFYNANGVSFGGMPATSFSIESDSVIKAVVGLGASGNVGVFTPAGDAVLGGFNFLSPKYVTQNGAGLKNGSSWANAWGGAEFANNLYNQPAGTSIWIAKGIYKPTRDENGVANANTTLLTFSVPQGVRVYGGFTGNENSITARASQSFHGINITRLSADIGTQNLQDDNCAIAVTLKNCGQNEILDGVTISNATSNGIKMSFNANVLSAPVISNCVITDNLPSDAGLLIAGNGSLSVTPVIRNTIFSNNHSPSYGAVLVTGNCKPVFENCIFYNNGRTSAAGTGAGGITFSAAAGSVINCNFYENSTNHAASNGAAIILNNPADSVYINNTIFWNNYSAGSIINLQVASGSNTASVKNCLFQTQAGGTSPAVLINTLTSIPDFINAPDVDGIDNIWGTSDDGLIPQPYSNVVDKGNNNLTSNAAITDLAVNPRIYNNTIDIGAYEVQNGLVNICSGSSTSLKSNLTGSAYQWQVNAGNSFTNIPNNTFYSGANTATLQLTAAPSSWIGYKFRCAVDGNYSREFILQFSNSWTGASNTLWENIANWSCGSLPDALTDVIISRGTVLLSSDVLVKSLSVQPGVIFTISPGNKVSLTGGAAATGTLGGSPGTCTPVTAAGLYKQGLALTASNTLQVQVNVTAAGPYFISTNTVNGVSFSKAGNFTGTGVQNVVLNGSGTPEFFGNQNFIVQFNNSVCSFSINFAPATPDYFPMVTNSKWSYKAFNVITEASDSVYKQCLPDYVTYNGKQYREFSEVSELLIDHSIGYRKNGNDYYLYYDHFGNTYSLLFLEGTGEIKFLNDNLPAGGTWTSNITGFVNGGSENTPIQVQGSILEKGVSATLSTGLSFSNVIKTRLLFLDMTIPGSPNIVYYEERWYALGVGLIYFKSGDPFGEGIRYELKRYQVN